MFFNNIVILSKLCFVVTIGFIFTVACGSTTSLPTSTPVVASTPTSTSTPMPIPSSTSTPAPTNTPSPTPTLLPSPTPTTTPSPSPSPTPTSTKISSSTGISTTTVVTNTIDIDLATVDTEILLFDDFSSNTNKWWIGAKSNERADRTNQFVNDKYRISIKAKQKVFNWYPLKKVQFKDFLFSIEATVLEVTNDNPDDVSLAFYFRRNANKDNYRINFYGNGKYTIGLRKENKYTKLYRGSGEIDFEPGQTNTFAILAKEANISFFVNNQPLVTITDSNLDEAGSIGLGVGLRSEEQTVTIDFDNLLVREAP